MVPGRRTVSIIVVALLAGAGLAGIAVTDLTRTHSNNTDCPKGASSCVFNITGEIDVESDYGAGMMNITVINEASLPFTNITVLSAVPGLSGLQVFTPFTTGGRVVSALNQLAVGMYSSGYYYFSYGGTSATPYAVTVDVTMTNGRTVAETVSIVSDS
jgi:hypothetical protein